MAVKFCGSRGDGVLEAGRFRIAFQAVRIGGDSLELQSVHRSETGIGLLERVRVNQAGNSLARVHGKVVLAFRADTKVLGEGEVVNHFSAGRAFRPESFRHLASLASNGLEDGFSKDRHD